VCFVVLLEVVKGVDGHWRPRRLLRRWLQGGPKGVVGKGVRGAVLLLLLLWRLRLRHWGQRHGHAEWICTAAAAAAAAAAATTASKAAKVTKRVSLRRGHWRLELRRCCC
jgi:hypothetical protein